MANILIIDDNLFFCEMLSRRINRLGHNPVSSQTIKEGLKISQSQEFDVIMLDVQLPDGNGIKAIPEFQELDYSPEIIIITGSGDPDGAELAIKWGAWDYIEKPATAKGIILPIIRALEYRNKKKDKDIILTLNRDNIIGKSRQIQMCLNLVAQAANSDINVLIHGDTGTGKELLAKAIHTNSRRAQGPFIVVDCAAIPESLAEELLFGHEKGTFTGADNRKIGLIEQAHKGTLFLDEIGELPMSIQKAFLRVLQERRYRPLGSKTEIKSDFRLISATNRQLEKMVRSNQFREDLLYRIRTFSINPPALRERTEDISDLAIYYVARECEKTGDLTKGFSPDFFKAIESYDWPGNVRELFHALDSAMVTANQEPVLFPRHLPVNIRAKIARSNINDQSSKQAAPVNISSLPFISRDSMETYKTFRDRLLSAGERNYFSVVSELSNGDVKKACQMSGLSASRFYFFLQKHKISLSDYKTA